METPLFERAVNPGPASVDVFRVSNVMAAAKSTAPQRLIMFTFMPQIRTAANRRYESSVTPPLLWGAAMWVCFNRWNGATIARSTAFFEGRSSDAHVLR